MRFTVSLFLLALGFILIVDNAMATATSDQNRVLIEKKIDIEKAILGLMEIETNYTNFNNSIVSFETSMPQVVQEDKVDNYTVETLSGPLVAELQWSKSKEYNYQYYNHEVLFAERIQKLAVDSFRLKLSIITNLSPHLSQKLFGNFLNELSNYTAYPELLEAKNNLNSVLVNSPISSINVYAQLITTIYLDFLSNITTLEQAEANMDLAIVALADAEKTLEVHQRHINSFRITHTRVTEANFKFRFTIQTKEGPVIKFCSWRTAAALNIAYYEEKVESAKEYKRTMFHTYILILSKIPNTNAILVEAAKNVSTAVLKERFSKEIMDEHTATIIRIEKSYPGITTSYINFYFKFYYLNGTTAKVFTTWQATVKHNNNYFLTSYHIARNEKDEVMNTYVKLLKAQ